MALIFNIVYSFVVFFLIFISINADICSEGVKCIKFKKCTGLYDQLKQDKSNAILHRLIRILSCGFDDDMEPMVCCPDEYKSTLVSRSAEENISNNNLLPNTSVCGVQYIEKVFGGTETQIDEYPWLALLYYKKGKRIATGCGGALISSRYILTAAHCISQDWKLFKVRLGEWNLTSQNDCQDGDCSPLPLDIHVEEAVAHELYDINSESQAHDIGIIRLSREVQYTDFIKPICLPISSDLKNNAFERYTAWVGGWGLTETNVSSPVKLKVDVPIVTLRDCMNKYSTANKIINDKQMCAGGTWHKDSCRGDSGGPLVIEQKGASSVNWVAIGIVSYGPSPCGQDGWPSVYTRLTSYIDWIQSKMRQ